MKNRIIRYTLNGVILAAVAAIGVAAYQIGTAPLEDNIPQGVEADGTESEELAKIDDTGTDDVSSVNSLDGIDSDIEWDGLDLDLSGIEGIGTQDENSEEAEGTLEEAGSGLVEAELSEDSSVTDGEADSNLTEEVSVDSNLIDIEVPEEGQDEAMAVDTSSQSILEQLEFSEETEMQWPVNGNILLDYNMDQTIYFPTLDQYKLSSAIAVQAVEGAPVIAAAKGTVYSIEQDARTGTTMTMELGDGYQAIYGQLKDLTVAQGSVVEKGEIIGYVNAPTKYYSLEGDNLYFAMKRNGEPIDPIAYLP